MRLGIFGRGRLGGQVAALARGEGGIELAWCLGRDETPPGDAVVDAVLDASAAGAVAGHLAWAAEAGVSMVVGTTGWDRADPAIASLLAAAAAGGPGVMVAPNFSLAVAFMRRAALALGRFAALQEDASLSVFERHHGAKADAPSGTAKLLAAALAEGCPRYSGWSEGGLPAARSGGGIPVASLRSGRRVGFHEITLETPLETIVLSHDASSREIFARGALAALRWMAGRRGLHSFDDMAASIIDPLFTGGKHG